MTLLVVQLHEVASKVQGTVTIVGPVRQPNRAPGTDVGEGDQRRLQVSIGDAWLPNTGRPIDA